MDVVRYCAAENSNFEIVELLLESGADVNVAAGDTGQTAIIYSVMKSRRDIVNLLLNHADINVDSCDNNGCNALLYPLKNENLQIEKRVELLNHARRREQRRCD